MSPSQSNPDQMTRREINGQRPSPLKINRESHVTHKKSSSSKSSFAGGAKPPPPQRNHPVIIYTHSPKVIRTDPRDFMAIVQKLTGFSKYQDPPLDAGNASSDGNNSRINVFDDATSSSVITDENCDVHVISSSVSPVFNIPSNPYFSDIPLFTPNSSDFFSSPHQSYSYSDSIFPFANMGSSISPSVIEFLKAFPEY
ncbi:VQ motif-containing protein 8, chloroplastic-like [Tasmannia lanceolata]|uniref:VQ motif-containing protein 8, chloroplastic-like n=1 Tax=Tasmannia lanceolata TaxID=3420 RepID=UPI0040631839